MVGKVHAKYVNIPTLKSVSDRKRVKCKSDWILYLSAKTCLSIEEDSYNCLCQPTITSIGEDEDRQDGSNGPRSVWSTYLLQVAHNSYHVCCRWRSFLEWIVLNWIWNAWATCIGLGPFWNKMLTNAYQQEQSWSA
jgi:hypothetical protein